MARVVLVLIALVSISLFGCSSTRQLATKDPANHSGVEIARSEQQAFTDALVRHATRQGYSVLDVTAYRAAFDREAPASWVLWTSPDTRKRLSFDFSPEKDSIFVTGWIEAVEPRGEEDGKWEGST